MCGREIMKKVLIYLNENSLAPTGGSIGYNYTLKKGLQEIDNEGIEIEYLQGKEVSADINTE